MKTIDKIVVAMLALLVLAMVSIIGINREHCQKSVYTSCVNEGFSDVECRKMVCQECRRSCANEWGMDEKGDKVVLW